MDQPLQLIGVQGCKPLLGVVRGQSPLTDRAAGGTKKISRGNTSPCTPLIGEDAGLCPASSFLRVLKSPAKQLGLPNCFAARFLSGCRGVNPCWGLSGGKAP